MEEYPESMQLAVTLHAHGLSTLMTHIVVEGDIKSHKTELL